MRWNSKKTVGYHSTVKALSGAAGTGVFKEIVGIDIPEPAEGNPCSIRFQYDGYAVDASVETYYDSIDGISVRWSQEKRLYNGVMGDFSADGKLNFDYINTYPNGFIMIVKDIFAGTDNVYLYQNALPDEGNGPTDEATPAALTETTSD